MAPGQLPADAPRGALEEGADGDAICHLVLGRPVRDGDLLAVQAPTDDAAVWLPVGYVAHTTHGVDRLPLLHPSWRVAIATVHGPADVAIDLPATAIMRWLVSARRLRADEASQLRKTADEIEECSAALRRAMQDPASGVGELGRRLLGLEAGSGSRQDACASWRTKRSRRGRLTSRSWKWSRSACSRRSAGSDDTRQRVRSQRRRGQRWSDPERLMKERRWRQCGTEDGQ
jgi:hypothetical protein